LQRGDVENSSGFNLLTGYMSLLGKTTLREAENPHFYSGNVIARRDNTQGYRDSKNNNFIHKK
jgi:hypothetical protein